ncbi:hypothetical protein PR202_gb13667 [Eleusine coracana subsp. coracana]|uniref:Auxilin-related protein 2 n=1 Tax=Eleusine coracana subsp. coracana TaxID=191504 RepID=A0AAV5ETL8_ELECO|nr:hypothetical protein PR202_gb13667 [Eleusine coracana subsp. coracana]
MDGIEGLLAQNFGVRPQGKAAPMAGASRPAAGSAAPAWTNPRSTPASSAVPSYDDLFSSPAPRPAPAPASASSFDSLFDSYKPASSSSSSSKPAFDDDIFNSVPGLKPSNSSGSFSSARYDGGDDLFGTAAAPSYDDVFGGGTRSASPPAYDDDLLAGFGSKPPPAGQQKKASVDDDDLLGGFGRSTAEEKRKPAASVERMGSAGFDDLIPGFAGSSPPRSRKTGDDTKKRPAVPTSKQAASMADDPFVVLETASASDSAYTYPGRSSDPLEDLDKSANSEGKNVSHTDADDSLFENPSAFDQVPGSDRLFTSDINGHTKNNNSNTSSMARDSSPVHHSLNGNPARTYSMEDLGDALPKSQSARYSDIHGDDMDQSPRSTESEDDIWLTVSEIPLFTQPTSAPPPSRSPPLLKQKPIGANANGKKNEHVRRSSQNDNHYTDLPKQPHVSSVDDLEGFARSKPQMPVYDNNVFDEDFERNSSDLEEKYRQERLEQEMRLREQKEREQRILEKKRELEQQRERERQAVEKATKEARERAAAEARAKTEREASQRAQRAAVQRVQQEARERAAAEAKERAARVAAEARERAAAEAKERAAAEAKEREKSAARERAAVERTQQEARKRAERAAVERAAAEARERQAAAAAAAAREKQSTSDDLESFFGAGSRASSAPKQRDPTPTVDSLFGSGAQTRGTVNGSSRAPSTSTSVRKTSSATSFGDDLSDLFGAPASSDVFQEVEGETEERRRARLERHQRTRERAAKALAEKNERDMQVQREQAERDRIGDTLDFEIKRWSAGKEGNLRALLSTLQYQYRKATLCIHPDKVQQKGATIQQKYIAEKVFDILKEAWNKFNSEELF